MTAGLLPRLIWARTRRPLQKSLSFLLLNAHRNRNRAPAHRRHADDLSLPIPLLPPRVSSIHLANAMAVSFSPLNPRRCLRILLVLWLTLTRTTQILVYEPMLTQLKTNGDLIDVFLALYHSLPPMLVPSLLHYLLTPYRHQRHHHLPRALRPTAILV